jgi:hypothetical protein
MAALWAVICASRIGRWVAGIALTLAALVAALFVAFLKGKRAQSEEDAVRQAEEQAAFGRLAQQAQMDAGAAVAKVQTDAAKQPAPDLVKRNDLDSTF